MLSGKVIVLSFRLDRKSTYDVRQISTLPTRRIAVCAPARLAKRRRAAVVCRGVGGGGDQVGAVGADAAEVGDVQRRNGKPVIDGFGREDQRSAVAELASGTGCIGGDVDRGSQPQVRVAELPLVQPGEGRLLVVDLDGPVDRLRQHG
jgi:hypothetical protein